MSRAKQSILEIFNERYKIVLLIIEIFTLGITIVLFWKGESFRNSSCETLRDIYKIIKAFFSDNEVSYMMDAFCLIWGMLITIILFLFEFGNSCWYGVRFKYLIRLAFGEWVLFLGGVEYFLICPVVYYAEVNNLWITCFWGIFCTFLAFGIVPLFAVYITRQKKIERLLQVETLKKINKRNEQISVEYIQMLLKSLPIFAVINHLEYENVREINHLVETFGWLFQKIYIEAVDGSKVFRHVGIMTWVDQVIDGSRIDTKQHEERTIYILRRLWEKIVFEVNKKYPADCFDKDQLLLECMVEFFLPVFYRSKKEMNLVFISLWSDIENGYKALPYLLLYVEFSYYDCLVEFSEESYCIADCIKLRRKELYCQLEWDETLAFKLWISWAVYKSKGNNLGLIFFLKFKKDVDNISQNELLKLRTYTMRKFVKILEAY